MILFKALTEVLSNLINASYSQLCNVFATFTNSKRLVAHTESEYDELTTQRYVSIENFVSFSEYVKLACSWYMTPTTSLDLKIEGVVGYIVTKRFHEKLYYALIAGCLLNPIEENEKIDKEKRKAVAEKRLTLEKKREIQAEEQKAKKQLEAKKKAEALERKILLSKLVQEKEI